MHKFYIKKDDKIEGPYSAKQMLELNLMHNTLVKEECINEWLPISKYDFRGMAKQELIQRLQKTSNSNVQTELKHSNVPDTSFPSTIEYKANFNEGANSIGGKIIITPDLIIFKAHSFNFGDLSDRIFKIQDVSGYRKGFLTFLYIQFKYGYEIKLTVWKKQEIITEIENRRKLLIASK